MKTVEQIHAEKPPKQQQIANPLVYDEIKLKDVADLIPAQDPMLDIDPVEGEPVVALGRAVYETQPQLSTDGLIRAVQGLTMALEPGNLWLLPTYERLPYPFAVYWPLACAFKWEQQKKRKFDWFVWADDDVLFTAKDVLTLVESAKKHGAPFVSATPYDRFPPHSPSVTEMVDNKQFKWLVAPESGTYPCLTVGLCLAVFHRSVFDLVEEPWFGVCSPSRGYSGLHPDWWWSFQMHRAGLLPHVCCDTHIVHLGQKKQITTAYSERWLDRVLPEYAENYESIMPEHRAKSPVTGAILTVPGRQDDGRSTLKAAPVSRPDNA